MGKSVPRVIVLASRGSSQWLTLMVHTANARITFLPYSTPLIHVSHFVLTSFSDALVTSLATKLRDVHYTY